MYVISKKVKIYGHGRSKFGGTKKRKKKTVGEMSEPMGHSWFERPRGFACFGYECRHL